MRQGGASTVYVSGASFGSGSGPDRATARYTQEDLTPTITPTPAYTSEPTPVLTPTPAATATVTATQTPQPTATCPACPTCPALPRAQLVVTVNEWQIGGDPGPGVAGVTFAYEPVYHIGEGRGVTLGKAPSLNLSPNRGARRSPCPPWGKASPDRIGVSEASKRGPRAERPTATDAEGPAS